MSAHPSQNSPGVFDAREIRALIRDLDTGNPGRDVEVRMLLRRILDATESSGLSAEIIAEIRQALERKECIEPSPR